MVSTLLIPRPPSNQTECAASATCSSCAAGLRCVLHSDRFDDDPFGPDLFPDVPERGAWIACDDGAAS